jgi:AAA15 family ATPase/GTPase
LVEEVWIGIDWHGDCSDNDNTNTFAGAKSMFIKAITIENFKGISKPVRIEFKPLTLLFGPNSGGKSSIIQALHYLREILENRKLDVDKTTAGGDFIDLGGFRKYVNGHDDSKRISFKIELNDIKGDYSFENEPFDRQSDYYELFNELQGSTSGYFEFSIALDRESVIVDKALFFLIDKYAYVIDNIGSDTISYSAIGMFSYLAKNTILSNITKVFDHFCKGIEFAEDKQDTYFTIENSNEQNYIKKCRKQKSDKSFNPLPEYNSTLLKWNDTEDCIFDYIRYGMICTIVDELKSMLYLGPLRTIPPRNYTPLRVTSSARWADGLAAWDKVSIPQKQFEGELQEINKWMGKERLDTGYILGASKKAYLIPLDHPDLKRLIEDSDLSHDDKQHIVDKLPIEARFSILQEKDKLEVSPCDVGVGISQVFPVVVACLEKDASFVIIEQPELHIHPRLQVNLGDLFINAVSKEKCLIIETHSEHLLLRVMRRMRETFNKNLPEGYPEIKPSEITILYVQPTDSGTVVRVLELDAEGQLLDQWPDGFFEEGYRERFA